MPIQNATETHMPEIGEMHPPGRKRTGARIVFYVVLLLVVGLIVWRVYQNHQKQVAATARQAAALQGRPVPVQVIAAEQKSMPIYLSALGTVTPYMSVTVKARVNGELLPVKFTEGQQVRAGETIMEIDPRPYQAALDQAKGTLAHDQALLKNAQAEYNRYKIALRSRSGLQGGDGGQRGAAGPVSGRYSVGPGRGRDGTVAVELVLISSLRSTARSVCGWWIRATSFPRTAQTW